MIHPLRVADALSELKKNLQVPSPEQEAHWILMDVLGCSFTDIVIQQQRVLTKEQMSLWKELLVQRNTGKPLAYVLGHQDFFKYRFFVNQHVLIPRPETELIVELATTRGPYQRIADLGTGSGCIGLSLMKEYPQARLWACDISQDALSVFNKNVELLKLTNRVDAALGAVTDFSFVDFFDLIVSNPPYISSGDLRVDADVLKYEPHTALFAPDDGLAYYKTWSVWAWKALKKNGVALFEFGKAQQQEVVGCFQQAGFTQTTVHKDLFGVERVICATKE